MKPRWLLGLAFPHKPANEWPSNLVLSPVPQEDPELKKIPQVMVADAQVPDPIVRLVRAYCRWDRLLRAVAWLLAVKQLSS